MTNSETNAPPAVGFLTVCGEQPQGLFGGFLVLNANGRPLEFHCTAPVKPNRAQEILYGAALEPYLYGELIGQALVKKAKSSTSMICTDLASVMEVRPFCRCPVVFVGPDQDPPETRPRTPPLQQFRLWDRELAVHRDHATDRDTVEREWSPWADSFDLAEPFERIREALQEARRMSRPVGDGGSRENAAA